jgi:nucleotide-binding universal stress UspA family protein
MESVAASSMPNRPFTIVCAVDLSENSPAVIEHALSESLRHRDVSMHFLTVCEPKKGRFLKKEPVLADIEEADQKLRALVRESLPTFDNTEDDTKRQLIFHTRSGRADDQILELALEARADRVVIGRHSNERHLRTLGGIAATVVNTAVCTVEVVQIPNYGVIEEDYETCAECVLVRERSGGEQWFCGEHNEGREPRLSGNLGVTSPVTGWGIF